MSSQREVTASDVAALSPEARERALVWLLDPPGGSRFLRQLKPALLALGTLELLVGSVEMVAANWSALGRWGRLGLIECVLLLCFVLAWGLGVESPEEEGPRSMRPLAGRWALTLAAGLVGVLLAAIGQTFQTGADSFLLFATWAILVTPWMVAARFTPLTVGWWLVAQLAVELFLYQRTGLSDEKHLVMVGLDALACGLALRWGQTAVARVAGLWAIWSALLYSSRWFIFNGGEGLMWLAGLLPTLLFAILTRQRDLLLFAASLLSLVLHTVLLMPRDFLTSALGLLCTAGLMVVELTLAAQLIRRTQRSS